MYDYDTHIGVLQTEADIISENLKRGFYSSSETAAAAYDVRIWLSARIQRVTEEKNDGITKQV